MTQDGPRIAAAALFLHGIWQRGLNDGAPPDDVDIRDLLCRLDAIPAPEGEAGDVARIRHIVWSHLAAVHTVTPPDPDGTRAFYSSDVREPLSSGQLAERIARDLVASPPAPGEGQGATEGVPVEVDGQLWRPSDCTCRSGSACPVPFVHFPPAPAGPQAEAEGETASALTSAPGLWWSPTAGLIRVFGNGGHVDAVPLTPACGGSPS